jgi:hypothetical protein
LVLVSTGSVSSVADGARSLEVIAYEVVTEEEELFFLVDVDVEELRSVVVVQVGDVVGAELEVAVVAEVSDEVAVVAGVSDEVAAVEELVVVVGVSELMLTAIDFFRRRGLKSFKTFIEDTMPIITHK